MRKCRTCGELFQPKSFCDIYCSKACHDFAIDRANERYFKFYEKQEWNKPRPKPKKPTFSMEQVTKTMRKYDVQYNRALEILEQERLARIGVKKNKQEKIPKYDEQQHKEQ